MTYSAQQILDSFPRKPWDHQVRGVAGVLRELETSSTVALCSPTGCHAKGHPILMHNGTIKAVEDVQVGDLVMGHDSAPRLVLQLCRGTDRMYKIHPRYRLKPFVVNAGHMLSLRDERYDVSNISVTDYIASTSQYKKFSRLHHVRVPSLNQNNTILSSFEVEDVGEGEFYGFTLSGDHMYLDGNFIRHHNSGKGLMQTSLLNLINSHQGRAIVYNNRRLLVQQTADRLEYDGISFGVRAASMKHLQNLGSRFQVGSIQTDIQRVLKQGCWDIHDAQYVFIDEAHTAIGPDTIALLQLYLSRGAKILGITATPLEISHIYQKLVVAGLNSEMRACGAHVRARIFAPHEMDCSKIRTVATGEFTDGDIKKLCWSQAIVGYIYRDWREFNPERRPTLIAAPGVSESMWVTNMFHKEGARVSHIDARGVWLDGEYKPDNTQGDRRKEALRRWIAGETEVMVNCQVLQEGFDFPGLYHLILARPYGSLKNYLQVAGRVIRSHPSTPEVIITDHGGNAIRHGSPNADRDWHELFHMTESEINEKRKQALQDEQEPEPITCPQCKQIRASGIRCPNCGLETNRRLRTIVEQSGELREMDGRVFVKPPKVTVDLAQRRWDGLFYAAKNSKSDRMTFHSAAHIYKKEHGEWPRGLKRQPLHESDWGRKIKHVNYKDLT